MIATGMMTCVGYSGPATCAAVRAHVANFRETAFIDRSGQWIMGAQPELASESVEAKLDLMLALAVDECLGELHEEQRAGIPLILCLAETDRAGRVEAIESRALKALHTQLGIDFTPSASIVAAGRASAIAALMQARALIDTARHDHVLIAGVDSYLNRTTMRAFERDSRLLTSANSNGFVPGEGAAAVLITRNKLGLGPQLRIEGLGLGRDAASIRSDLPLRADGLTQAIGAALEEAKLPLHQIDYRIADLSGEQFFFKEAALAATRLLRQPHDEFDLWHPADCVGETGAVAGLLGLAIALAAGRKRYAPGPRVLLHCSSDDGLRGAGIATYGEVDFG